MPSPRRVLVLGASGMIGREVLREARGSECLEMLPASHRPLPGHLQFDDKALVEPGRWMALLRAQRVDAVLNCVGIWSGSDAEFERVQFTLPVAMFEACARLGLRVVHVSALGFQADSALPYVSTKARADRELLARCPQGVLILPSLVFGPEGRSTRFFLGLAALPVQVDFGLPRNLQPVHVREVARAVVSALRDEHPPRVVECAGTHAISIPEYFDALRQGMGLRPAPLRLRLPTACGLALFTAGQWLGAHFVNRQTWLLLQAGTQCGQSRPEAMPYASYAGPADLQRAREDQLHGFARLSLAFLWLWTAFVTWFVWPAEQSLAWLDQVWPGLGTPAWLAASCVLDAALGVASLWRPGRRLWLLQFWVTALYTVALGWFLPWTWSHPLGPLTKNLAVMATTLWLALRDARSGR